MKKKRSRQLGIPPAADTDRDLVEMIRVWRTSAGLHYRIKLGGWDAMDAEGEEFIWGGLLSDLINNVADLLHEAHGRDRDDAIRTIRRVLDAELDNPNESSWARGRRRAGP
jgi:hypothetical protein